LHCWICPRTFALSRAGDAFNPQDELIHEAQQKGVQAVIDQVLWAAARLHS
jgi:chromate reductase, NAD(P)H dehydrogenase (quinone)